MSRNPKKNRVNIIPIFISKLHQMVEDINNSEIISWTSNGDSFGIKNISSFTENTLPIYFKHRNFASFIRQLNMYGFRKIRHNEGENVYFHENFRVGAKHLLRNITRKIKEEKDDQVSLYRGGNRHQDPHVNKQIQELRNNQNNLAELCQHFIEQNQRLLQENNSIARKMEEDDRQKERKLEELLVFLLTQADSKSLLTGKHNEGMLSITNATHSEQDINDYYGNESPLEAIGNAIDSNSKLYKAKQLIQGIYTKKNKRKENFSYVEPQPNSQVPNSEGTEQKQPQAEMKQAGILQQPQSKSFLSINDFLNIEDDKNHFDLQNSF